MLDFDVAAIVPSTRDLLQTISTKRKSLALVPLMGGQMVSDDASRLHDLNVSAFAAAEPGPVMRAAATATKTVPSLSLAPVRDKDGCLAARFYGADGVCIDATMPLDDWDRVAKQARTMRMLPLALATDAAAADAAVKAGARAILLQTPTAALAIEIAQKVARSITLLAYVENADADALRSLVGHVDAAVVPPAVHGSSGFAELAAEVDP